MRTVFATTRQNISFALQIQKKIISLVTAFVLLGSLVFVPEFRTALIPDAEAAICTGMLSSATASSTATYITSANQSGFPLTCKVTILAGTCSNVPYQVAYSFDGGTNKYLFSGTQSLSGGVEATFSESFDFNSINPVGFSSTGAKSITCYGYYTYSGTWRIAPTTNALSINRTMYSTLPTESSIITAPTPIAGDQFGNAVALSGDELTLATASATNLFISTRSGSVWSNQATLTPSAYSNGQLRYSSVALSSDGNTLIVGTQIILPSSQDAAVYVFTRSGSTWTQQAMLQPSAIVANDYFGNRVALSADGNTALMGAHGDNAAYVFTRSGSTWTQQQKLVGADTVTGTGGDDFGNTVSISSDGNTALIASHSNDLIGKTNAGAVYVFTRSGSTWTQQQKLTASDSTASANLGSAVSVASDGNTAIIGAEGVSAAYVFTRSGSTWTQAQKLTNSSAAPSFGGQVAVVGSRAIVGAIAPEGTGVLYIYTGSGGSWTQEQSLIPSTTNTRSYFGRSFSLGTSLYLAVGGAEENSLQGVVHMF